jgi:hypothetical protein
MKLSQALMVSLCCIGIAGCAGLSTRSEVQAPAPALRAAGPDPQFAAPPPPPPPVPPSTITVAPQRMYNMSAPAKKSTAPAPVRKSAPAPAIEDEPEEKPIREEGASLSPAQPAAPAPADDAGAVARPVRRSERTDDGSPQSAVKPKTAETSPVEVVPVSQPPAEKKVDTRLTS